MSGVGCVSRRKQVYMKKWSAFAFFLASVSFIRSRRFAELLWLAGSRSSRVGWLGGSCRPSGVAPIGANAAMCPPLLLAALPLLSCLSSAMVSRMDSRLFAIASTAEFGLGLFACEVSWLLTFANFISAVSPSNLALSQWCLRDLVVSVTEIAISMACSRRKCVETFWS